MLNLRGTAKVGISPPPNPAATSETKAKSDIVTPLTIERTQPQPDAQEETNHHQESIKDQSHQRRHDDNNNNNNNDNKNRQQECDIYIIQQWHVVLGDTSARDHRTTEATKLLRRIKREWKQRYKGKKWKIWVPLATRDFYRQLRTLDFSRFHVQPDSDDDLGRILLKCNDKTKDRMLATTAVPCYKYPDDEKPLYGIAKPQQALRFFFLSRDSPTLASELMRHQKQFALLQQNNDDVVPPKAMMDTFAGALKYYQENLKKAEQGEVMATTLLNLSPSPINQLKALWDKLSQECNTAKMKRDDSVDTHTISESDPESNENNNMVHGKNDSKTKDTAKQQQPKDPLVHSTAKGPAAKSSEHMAHSKQKLIAQEQDQSNEPCALTKVQSPPDYSRAPGESRDAISQSKQAATVQTTDQPPEHPLALATAESLDPVFLLLQYLEQDGIDLAQASSSILEALKECPDQPSENGALLQDDDSILDQDWDPLPWGTDDLDSDSLWDGLNSIKFDGGTESDKFQSKAPPIENTAVVLPTVGDDAEISSSQGMQRRIHPRDETDAQVEAVAVSRDSKRVCLLGGFFFPLMVVTTIALACFVPRSKQHETENYAPSASVGEKPFNPTTFDLIVDKLENDVVEFGQHLEQLLSNPCDQLDNGFKGSYDACQSSYPNAECLGSESFYVTACGGGGDDFCPGMYDFSVSTVRLPVHLMPGDNNRTESSRALEVVSYTQGMEEWLQRKRTTDQPFWDTMNIHPRAWHFGSTSGAFRIYPARPSEECGVYDPRVRPWYVSASSGPKNVVMLLDTSRSMAGFRLKLLQEAAKRVVSTLTFSDRISIVPFGSDASRPMTDKHGRMLAATEENKKALIHKIDKLKADGQTNIYDGFEKAFDILDHSAVHGGGAVHCNTAVLFLTDGQLKEEDYMLPDSENFREETSEGEILELVRKRLDVSARLLSNPVLLFTYSISDKDQLNDLPSKLACSTKWGTWSHITSDANIIDKLSSYYKIFAIGLGSDTNKDFVTWVLPYEYDPGETLGTSVSVPVYDRSKNPSLFLGVATIDVSMAALDAAVGSGPDQNSEGVIRGLASRSKAHCPVLELGRCQMESFRRQDSPDHGGNHVCSTSCTMEELTEFEQEMCPLVGSEYPADIWANTDNAGLAFAERGACVVAAVDDHDDDRTRTVLGVVLIGVFVLLYVGVVVVWRKRKRTLHRNEEHKQGTQLASVDEEHGVTADLSSMSLESQSDDCHFRSSLAIDKPL